MFGHLHVHTTFSLLDGMSKIDELVERVAELGQTFCSITDHGSTSGLYEFQKTCESKGIKPILGTEFYTDSPYSERKSGHLIALAKNNKGLENIFKLQEYAYTEGFAWKPRVTFEMLKKHKEGLIITSACLANTINQHLMQNRMWEAICELKAYKEEFGDDFYLEIQSNTLDEQKKVNQQLVSLAQEYDVQLVMTNDVHYVQKDDWKAHDVLLALQTHKKMDDPKRWSFPSQDFWVKSREEMEEQCAYLDSADVQKALDNTQIIADKCNARIEKGNFLPKYHDVPEKSSPRKELVELAKIGVQKKNFAAHVKEIQEEIDLIDEEGLSDYFLIVQDYINAARREGILVGDGRGSGAGSKLGYVLDMARVNPVKYDLLFERFMSKGRHPDWDCDFSDQDWVFKYLQEKHGRENVAHIVTFGKMTPKAVSRKVFSAFGFSMLEIKRINNCISETDNLIEDALSRSPELRAFKRKYSEQFDIIERLEGVISHEGKHAGGVIIQKNLTSKLPIKTESKDNRQGYIVCMDKYMLEELGHWKLDILGLETLPVLKRTLESIKTNYGKEVELSEINYEDKTVYEQLSSGDVSGVFQLSAQAGKVMEQEPKCFDDLIAINALIRPQADGFWEEYIERRNGKAWSVHKNRERYMKRTQGMMAYQEQFLLDAVTFAGWGVAYADKHLRKNKDIRNDVELKAKFLHDSLEHGYVVDDITHVWREIEDAVDSGYSFNAAHAASYSIISYQTAWLKCYYPNEFYASIMTSKGDNQNDIAGLVAECNKKGIKILPPDINESTGEFVPTKEGIMYRITTITHVGDTAIRGINYIKPIASFEDMLERRTKKYLKDNAVKSLIKAGAFDSLGEKRHDLLWKLDMHNRNKTAVKNDVQCETYADDAKTRMTWEKESLGMYISSHPMDKYSFKPFDSFEEDSNCLIGGEVLEIAKANQKNGKEMAFITLDTGNGVIRVLVFANSWSDAGTKLLFQEGCVILVRGRKSGDAVLFNSGEELI